MGLIRNFLIALTIVSMISGAFVLFLTAGSEKYDTSFDNSSISQFNNLSGITAISDEMLEKTNELETDSGILDILGYIYNSALGVVKLTFRSLGIFTNMLTSFFSNLELGSFSGIYISAFGLIITIIIIMAVLSAYLKWKL